MNDCVKKSDNTNYTFKILYAIGIFFVVAEHCHLGGFSFLYEFFPVAFFNTCIFIFASGYFYKSSYEENIKKTILNKAKRLILPLFLWNIFYGLFVQFIKIFGFNVVNNFSLESIGFIQHDNLSLFNLFIAPILHGHQFVFNLGGWFIIPLFITQVLNILVRSYFKKNNIKINEILYFLACLFLGTIGTILAYLGYNKGIMLFIIRILFFIHFYALGILYKKYEKYDNLRSSTYFGIIFALALLIIFINGGIYNFSLSWAKYDTDIFANSFVLNILCIFFYLRVAKLLTLSIGKSKTVNLIANNTFSIMVNHVLGFFLLNALYAFLSIHTPFLSGFNMYEFKNNIWYFYLPYNIKQMLVLYLISGISFSLFVKYILNKIKSYILSSNIIKNCINKG